jgi:hypothetical protein
MLSDPAPPNGWSGDTNGEIDDICNGSTNNDKGWPQYMERADDLQQSRRNRDERREIAYCLRDECRHAG